jgi:hypothetical protein
MSETTKPLQAPAPVSRVIALTSVILFMMTTAAAVQLARKLEEARQMVRVARAEQDRQRQLLESQRMLSEDWRQRLTAKEKRAHDFYRPRLHGHSHGMSRWFGTVEPSVGRDAFAYSYTHLEGGDLACSGTMSVKAAVERRQFRHWLFNIDGERLKSIRFRYSVEPQDSPGFLLRDRYAILTAEILPVLTASDQVEFFLWVSSSLRPSDPFPRRLVSLGRVPSATAETDSFVLIDRLDRAKPLRPGDMLPLFDVVRQSDGETVVSLTGVCQGAATAR